MGVGDLHQALIVDGTRTLLDKADPRLEEALPC